MEHTQIHETPIPTASLTVSLIAPQVRYGTHSPECPLVHRITSSSENAVNCFDVEVRSPPPSRTGKVEVEEIVGHEIVKVREKIRVFKKVLKAGEEYVR